MTHHPLICEVRGTICPWEREGRRVLKANKGQYEEQKGRLTMAMKKGCTQN